MEVCLSLVHARTIQYRSFTRGRQHERSAPPEGVSDYKTAGWLGDALQIVDRS
jgi:hypothetical protein